jgi:UDP-N-acetylenolpyruvoylglucosamine reductase
MEYKKTKKNRPGAKLAKEKYRRIREACKIRIETISDKNIIKKLLQFICSENIPFRIIGDGFDILLHQTSLKNIEKLENELNLLLNSNDDKVFSIDFDNII